jgi:dihydropteroate synthase
MAVKAAMQMVEDGADIIDIGGESTRPGAEEVRVEEEMLRTIPVIREIRTGQGESIAMRSFALVFSEFSVVSKEISSLQRS